MLRRFMRACLGSMVGTRCRVLSVPLSALQNFPPPSVRSVALLRLGGKIASSRDRHNYYS